MTWRAQALCHHVDPEVFFPDKGGSAREAVRICEHCPAREPCLAWAVENHGDDYGIWGGKTREERKEIRRMTPRPQVRHGTRTCYQYGCREPECCAANREYLRMIAARRDVGVLAEMRRS